MTIHITGDFCKGCGMCIYYCPKEVLQFSQQKNKKGYSIPEAARPENCKTCKICEVHCPDFAIYIEAEE